MMTKRALQLLMVTFLLMQFAVPISVLAATAGEEEKININTASAGELTQIKGIGEKLATSIIEYRDQNGPFASVDDLKKVKGVGEKILEQNKQRLCVGSDC